MRFIQGEKIFSGKNYITGNKIIVLNEKNNFVEFTSDTEIEKSKIEMHNGILCPGFVNAHCHLELSHLFKKIKPAQGLPAFAFEVVSQRNSFNDEEKIEAMFNADLQMQKNGIVAILGQSELLLPGQIRAALSANNRIKFLLTALQAAEALAAAGDDDDFALQAQRAHHLRPPISDSLIGRRCLSETSAASAITSA